MFYKRFGTYPKDFRKKAIKDINNNVQNELPEYKYTDDESLKLISLASKFGGI